MTTPPTTVSAVLLVDQRIQGYDTIASAVKSDVRCIVFDANQVSDACNQQSITSFQYILNKIAELGASSIANIGIVQHNHNTSLHQFFGVNSSELSTVAGVETSDPSLQTWASFAGFITTLKTTYGVQNVDLMACALYSNPDWKYIIDTLATQTAVEIRASTDDTGAAALGGNWFLESHTGVNLKSVYFTDAIDAFSGLLKTSYELRQKSTKGFATGSTLTWGTSGNGGSSSSVSSSLTSGVVAVSSTDNAFAALKSNGSVITWGDSGQGGNSSSVSLSLTSDVVAISSTGYAFAALKSNGSVITWGDSANGGNSSSVSSSLTSGVVAVYSNYYAFAALKSNGSVITWGDTTYYGGNSSSVASSLTSGVIAIYTSGVAFAALKSDGSVVSWGYAGYHVTTFSSVASSLTSGVVAVYSTRAAFAALKSDGRVITWGDSGFGADSTSVVSSLTSGVVTVYSNFYAFAALKSDGSVITWGNSSQGGDSSSVASSLTSGVISISSNLNAFAALKNDGSVIVWGNPPYGAGGTGGDGGGGSISAASSLTSGVVAVYSCNRAFAAIKTDGSVVTWGYSPYGGSSSSVASSLTSGVVAVYSTGNAFAALKNDGRVITWGHGGEGGDSSSVSVSSGVVSVYSAVYAFAVIKTTATTFDLSMAYYTDMDRFEILRQKENRRRVDLTNLNNNVFTISQTRDLQVINPNIPSGKILRIIVPAYTSSSSYSITSTATIPSGTYNFIIACNESEPVTISGVTYINFGSYVYKRETNNTYTKLTSATFGGYDYDLYGGDGVNSSGIVLLARFPSLSNFGPFPTLSTTGAYTLPKPTSNLATVYGSTWAQVGGTLNGSGSYSYFGTSVCTSTDGTTVIVGAPQTTNPTTGYAGVYKNISGTWTLLGSLLYGDTQSDHFGESVSISADGTIIAVGATQHNGFIASGNGYVKVFKYISSAWVQQGANITGRGSNFQNGSSVSLSANGKVLAIGERYNTTNGSNAGCGRIFSYDEANTTWTQLGGDIYGPSGSWFGHNISLSSDGSIVAISGPQCNTTSLITGGGGAGGIVRIFQYDSSKTTNITDVSNTNFGPIGWKRLGGDFYGIATAQCGGFKGLNISSSGTMIAIGYGTYSNMGIARVFKYDISKITNVTTVSDTNFGPIGWYRLGSDLVTTVSEDAFGCSVSLSNDGTIVSVGGMYIDSNSPTNNNNIGGVKSYSYSSGNNTWSSIGQTLYGLSSWEILGGAISSSGTGAILAISANGGDLNGTESGYVKIYNIDVSGGFTYSSNNTSVAEVYSSVVLPKGNGTVVITAQQSGYDGFMNNSITANLTVRNLDPTYTFTVSKPQSITKTLGDATFSLSDLLTGVSNSSGAYTFATSNSGAISIGGDGVTATVAGYSASAVTITATQAAAGNYSGGSTTLSITVNGITPTYTPASPSASVTKTYGVDVSFSLTALVAGISDSNGAYTFTSSSGAVSISGGVATIVAYTPSAITITAAQDASGNYASGSTAITVLVNRGTPTYQSVSPVAKTYGTDASFSLTTVMSGISNSSGAYAFSVNPTITTQILSTNNMNNVTSGNFNGGQYQSNLVVAYAGNLAGWDEAGDSTVHIVDSSNVYGSATNTPNYAIMFISNNVITQTTAVSNSNVTGSQYTVNFKAGPAVYQFSSSQATQATASDGIVFEILRANNTVLATSTYLPGAWAGYPTLTPSSFTYTGDGSGDVRVRIKTVSSSTGRFGGCVDDVVISGPALSSSSVLTISGNTATIIGAGTATILATQDASGNYASSSTTISLAVAAATPTFQSVAQISKTYRTDVSFSMTPIVSGMSNSDGAFIFTTSGSAVGVIDICGAVVTILAYTPSAVNIDVYQEASGNYTYKTGTISLLVARKVPSYGAFTPPTKTFGDASFSMVPYAPTTDSSGVAITYTSSAPSVATISSDGTLVTIVGHGSTTITASQAATGNFAASSTTGVLTVNRLAPTFLKAFTIDNKTFGDAPFSLLPFTVGLDNTDGTYHFSSSNPSIVSISNVDNVTATILAYTPSPITITVDIDACGNYAAATTSGTLTVARLAPTYQSVSQVAKTFGVDASFSLTAVMTGISNSNGAYTFSGGAGVISISGGVATILAYTPEAVTITASQDASGNYAASSKTFTLLVARGTPTYQTVSQVAKTFGVDASFSLTAVMSGISNSSGAYTFSSASGAVSISGDVATINAYTPSAVTLTATQDASGNYAASSKTFTVLVSRGTPTYQTVSQVAKTFGVDASFSLTAVMSGISNSDGAYTFSGGAGVISISGGVATILAYTPSAVTLTATQDASGNYAASSKTFTLLVSRGTPTLSNFNNVNKIYGNSPFSITPPTSNSSGAFTYTSSNTSVATISSINSTSLDFDGGNDNVTVANIGSFSSLTLEVFVYNTLSTNGNNYAQLVSRGANGNGWDWALYLIPPAAGYPMNTLRWVGPGGTTINTNVIELNTWTHVAVTCNNVQTKIYINGALITTQSTTNTMTNYTSGIMFGNDISQTRPYKGRLSDVRIWNVIRTASEIANNYQLSLAGNESGLVGNWKLNQGTAGSNNSGVTTAIDSSSSGKNGTLNNFSLSGSTSNWMAGPTMAPSITIVSPGTSTITAAQDANGNYQSGTISSTLTVTNSTPTYQSVAQISKTYGTDVSFSLASYVVGISDSSGAYTFSSSSAAISISGDVVTILAYTPSAASITATQAAAGNYITSSTTLSLLVGRAAPTYQSVAQITKTFGVDVSFSLASAVAGISNSDGTYSTFSSASGAVSISGNVVTILAYTPSAITITASQDASGNYSASSKTISLLVNRGPPTYQSVSQVTKTYGTDVSFSMTAVMSGISNSDGAYTFSTAASADLISISGAVVTINAYTPSAVTITASQEASGNYTSSSTTVTLLVSRKVPSYGAFTLPAVTYEDAPYSLVSSAPTSESNAAYSYTSSNAAVATVNSAGTVVTVIGQGYTTITASQDISGNYAAGSTTASLLVNRAAPTFLKAFTIDNKTFGDAAFSLLPFTVGLDNTDGTYHFSSSDASVVSISEADGVTATILAYSATPVTIYVAIDACGNYAASTTSGTLTISRKVPAYQAVSTVTKTFGDAAFSLVSYMTGISESSGSYTFASSDVSAVSIGGDGVTATINAYTASAITITASQAASGNYAAGTKTFSLTVARGAPTIGALGLGPLNGYYDVSNGYFTLTAPTSNSSGAFTYASDNSAVAIISTMATMTTANLLARYDASVSSSYTLSGSNVTQWNDLTGNGYHLFPNGTGPTVSTINSVPAFNFNSGYGLIRDSVPLSTSITVFMTITYKSLINVGGNFMHHGSRDADWSLERYFNTSQFQFQTVYQHPAPTIITLGNNTNYILIGRMSGTTIQFWTYSDTLSPEYMSGTSPSLVAGNKPIYVGKSDGGEACNSIIGEILYYNASLSDADLNTNLVYLQNKWFNTTNTTSSTSSVVRLLTAGTANISATQDICGNYSTGSVSSLLRVGATVPTFGTFTVSSTTKTYGDGAFTLTPPTSNSNGAFTFTSSNSSIVSISGTTATIVAGGTVDITVTQNPSGSFTRKSVTSSFTVQPKNPNLRNFPAIVKSFADGSFTVTQPDTDGSGYFTYTASPAGVLSGGGMMNPSFGIIGGGSTVITATQVGSQNYAESSITAAVTVTPVVPSASYSNFTRAFDVGIFTIPAPTTASSGTISYVSSDTSVATISGSTVTIRKVGDTTITATIAATATYLTRDISAVLSVTRGTPSISGLYNQTITMTQAPFTLSPTSSSNGTFSYVSDNSAVVFMTNSGTMFNAASVGTATITATITQDTSANYNTRNYGFTMTVIRATSNLSSRTFTVPALMTYGDTPVNITTVPTSDSSGAITYTSANTNVATIHPTTGLITAVGAGWNYFVASQAETNVHNASTVQSNYMQFVSKTVTQTRVAPYTSSTITKYYGDASFQLMTSSESTASKLFSLNTGGVVTLSTSSNIGYVDIINVGTVVITGQQFANSQYSTQNNLTWTLTVEKGTTSLTGLAATLTKNVTEAPFVVAVTSASTGTKSYALSNPAQSSVLTVDSASGLVTLKSPGTATIVASQAASSLYNAPTSVSCVITVASAGTILQGTTLTSPRVFDTVDMSGSSLANANVTSVSFTGSTFTNSLFTGATLTNSTLTNVNLSNSTMANTTISGTSFAGATMTRVVMTGSTLSNSTLTSTDLSGATMTNATITGSTFVSATMTNAVLTGATLTNSTLTSTVLTGASLVRANVTGSTFVGASLANADLSGATVTNANFTNANISGANITNVAFSPLQKIQLLKNTNNRAIGGIQVGDVSGSTILSAISETSPAVSIPNIATSVIKVVIPTTSTSASATLTDVVLDTTASDKFYFPINEGEYFQIMGVKYYTDGGIVKNAATNATVNVISYGTKSIWLIAGSIVANVLAVNTLSASTFTVPPGKMVTDSSFNITVAPTSNSNAPIVYSSNNPSVATIHPSTGVITIVGQGYVNFIATQAATLLYEAGTKMSNTLNVNILVDFTLNGLNQTILMTTSGLLDSSGSSLETTDATAVFYVKVSDMTDLFKFQTDSLDLNDDPATDVKYYVFNRKWPAALKINPAHAMLNKTESNGMLGSASMFTENKMLAKHDFIRYLSQQLFNTIFGVDLFSNESDLLENATYWGENVRVNIKNILASISTTSSDATLNYDVSGNKYLTNAVTTDTNICRELVRQMAAAASSRFGSITNGSTPQNVPFVENDSINFKVTFQSTATQNMLTGVESIPTRSYMVKLVMKNSISGLNTAVADSEMFPNAYPYSSAVTSYAPTSASSAVYNSYSPPAPMPFARFGFDGWYYTNSTAWVTSAYRNHIKWLMPANSGSSTVGSLLYIRVNLKIHNKIALPYIMVYTQSNSTRKYPVTNTGALANGTAYSFYVNFNSYTRAPATIGFTNAAMSNTDNTGSFANNELIMNIALETDISAAAGTVDFTLSSVVIGDASGEKEYGFEADVPAAYP